MLTKEIKNILGPFSIIMIDQEGGKVSRLSNNEWPEFPAANFFGKIAENNIEYAKKATFKNFYLIGKELKCCG